MALLLYAFCPLTIANSSYISYDVGLSCFFTLSLYWFWRFVTEGTWPNLLWTGLLLGCALASKTPTIVLPPVFVVLMLLAVWRSPRREHSETSGPVTAASLPFPLVAEAPRDRLRFSLPALALIFLMAFGVLYTVYIFPDDPLFYIKATLLAPKLHPPNYLYYLMGQFRAEGWWYYFLVAFALKTPIPMLLLIPLALWHWGREGWRWFPEAFLLLPALALTILISALADPLGLRYLLPIYPLLFIFVSRTAPLLTRKTAGVVAGSILAAWYLSTPIRIYPDYLAYFNELIGGPRHGIEYLDDANIDWGQNLKRLKRYLDARRFDEVKLFYAGEIRPASYGIRAEPMQFADLGRTPEPGIYVICSHGLVRARAFYGINWLNRYELIDHIGYAFYVFKVG
jgi:4-amino-4-deoxy-L-arabinose transferase-like glycosyltransferase